ncbi:7TM diverse intracellular signaling domain-containing protein [Anditalea andensis]|uniref:7TM diverse intracellular signaling domain-containing protein n=1 Tax=Anditalea andensis TaxID=1048983 RepID=UPI001F0AF49F|nr:7TM diverse intracellular signaling domain-containing protein [Anditalea andensis]
MNQVKVFSLYHSDTDYIKNINELSLIDEINGNISHGFIKDKFIVGFNFKGRTFNENEAYVLEFTSPLFHKLDLYIEENGQLKLFNSSGTSNKLSNPLTYPRPIFEISYADLKEGEFIAVITSNDPIGFNVIVEEKESFLKIYSNRMLLINIYVGLMLALFLYNIILYFIIEDKVYMYYSLYVLFIGLAQLSLLGFSHIYILGENPYLFSLSIIVFPAIAGVLAVLFIKSFLKTKYFVPALDKLLIIIIILYIAGIIVRLLGFVEISYRIIDITGFVGVILFITIGITIARKGSRPAVFFLIAWGTFLVGLLIYVFQNQGIIPSSSLSTLPMLLGTAIEAILLSLALADRINILKKEKEQEQHDRLEAVKENERLIREQNAILEEKVQSRTHELEVTLRNLQNTQTQLVNQEKMASLGQLTAGVAHEINNPINFVSSNINPLKRDIGDVLEIMEAYRDKGLQEFNAETLKELSRLERDIDLEYVKEEITQLLQGMEDGAKRTVEIVKGLKLFSRVDEQDVKKVDLHSGINSTLVLLNSSMSNKIKIVKDFGELPMVDCLAGKINQVFMNIVNNAVHALTENLATNPNPVIVIKTSTEGEFARIEIIDNGPGIPAHVKERIFEPFFTTKPVGKGTGLGLSIVYSIIEKHHGSLEVETVPDAGTSFIIKLPINQKSSMI